MNQIIIIGNLGRDPEMRYTPKGTAVTSFTVASNNERTVDGEKVKETTWFRVTVWGNQAEACASYLNKGSLVAVFGTMVSDPKTGGPKIWTAKDGTVNASHEVNANMVKFLSSPRSEGVNEQFPQEGF